MVATYGPNGCLATHKSARVKGHSDQVAVETQPMSPNAFVELEDGGIDTQQSRTKPIRRPKLAQFRHDHSASSSQSSSNHDDLGNPNIYVSDREERCLSHPMFRNSTRTPERKHQAPSIASYRIMEQSPTFALPAASEVLVSNV